MGIMTNILKGIELYKKYVELFLKLFKIRRKYELALFRYSRERVLNF